MSTQYGLSSGAPADFNARRSAMERIIAHHIGAHNRHDTPVPGLSVAHIVASVPRTTYIYEPSLCLCVRGSKQVWLADAHYVYDETHFLLTSIGLPTIVDMGDVSPEAPYTALKLDLDLDLARQIIAEIDLNGLDIVRAEPAIAVRPISEDLFDALFRLISLLDKPKDIQIMGRLIHREILYRLLIGSGGERLRQMVRIGSQSNRVGKAVAWLRANFQRHLKIEELAEIAGMGISTLHRHFQDLTTMSPLQYQKHLRLHEARRLMLSEDIDVGTTALTVGYESVTQFSREYRRLFGEPPLRDIKALRAHNAA